MNDCWDMVFYAFWQVKCGGGLGGIPEWVLEISIVIDLELCSGIHLRICSFSNADVGR